MPSRSGVLHLRAHAVSDVGLVRPNNEDAWEMNLERGLFVLADGMGGHQAGEVASSVAVEAVCRAFERDYSSDADIGQLKSSVLRAIEEANKTVYSLSCGHELLRGMGTTLCVLAIQQGDAILAHVGDSRIYRMRNGALVQMTVDHSLLCEMLDSGVSEEELDEVAYKNVLTRAIGTDWQVEPSLQEVALLPYDLFLLCSDGVTDMVSHQEMAQIISLPLTVEEKVRSLVARAKQNGGYDNITVVLVEAVPGPNSA